MAARRTDVTRSAILAQLGVHGSRSRVELAAALDVSPALITQLVKGLLDDGLVREAGQSASSGGRPARQLELSVDVGTAIGVKVADDHLVAVEVRIDGTVTRSANVDFGASARDAVATLVTLVEQFIEDGGDRHVLGLGVGVPGVVPDPESGVVHSTQLGWMGVPLGRELRSRTGLPVLVDNNVNAVALTQLLYGQARGYDDCLVVTIGTGVGAGLVVDGAIRRGHAGTSGEIGHLPVVEGGQLCHCGNRGCLETVVGERGLLGAARAAGVLDGGGTSADLLAQAKSGSRPAAEVFAHAGAVLGAALGGVVNVLGPEAVVILGEGVPAWSYWQPGFEPAFRGALDAYTRSVAVEIVDTGDDRWAQGAACLVLGTPFDAANTEGEQGRMVRSRLVGAGGAPG